MILMISISLMVAVIGLIVLPGLGTRPPKVSRDIRDPQALTQFIHDRYCLDCGQELTNGSHRRCKTNRSGPGHSP